MRLPPPFLVLFGIEYVRIINISAATKLGIHTDLCSLWVPLKGYGAWIQNTWDWMPALPCWHATFLFQSRTEFWFGHLKNAENTLPISTNARKVK